MTPTVPVRVDYTLTETGAGLYALLAQVRDGAGENAATVDAARAAYDKGSSPAS